MASKDDSIEATFSQSTVSSYNADGTDFLLHQQLAGDRCTGILEKNHIQGQGDMPLESGLPLRGLISSKEYRNIFEAVLSSWLR